MRTVIDVLVEMNGQMCLIVWENNACVGISIEYWTAIHRIAVKVLANEEVNVSDRGQLNDAAICVSYKIYNSGLVSWLDGLGV